MTTMTTAARAEDHIAYRRDEAGKLGFDATSCATIASSTHIDLHDLSDLVSAIELRHPEKSRDEVLTLALDISL